MQRMTKMGTLFSNLLSGSSSGSAGDDNEKEGYLISDFTFVCDDERATVAQRTATRLVGTTMATLMTVVVATAMIMMAREKRGSIEAGERRGRGKVKSIWVHLSRGVYPCSCADH